jgi:MFS family permease
MSVPADIIAVFIAKTARTFCYGFLGILLPVCLSELGMSASGVGVAVTLALVASAVLTGAVRRPAERYGARTALGGLAGLSVVSALLLITSSEPWLVVAAAMIGNVAVGTGETGAFLSLEQVAIARGVVAERRTWMLSVYNLLGYGAAALGAATIGALPAFRPLFLVFLVGAAVQLLAYTRLPDAPAASGRAPGLALPSAPLIRRLAALFALDSFAGGFVLQSLVAFFLHARFGLSLESLGVVFFVGQILTAASLLLAARLASRFGLLATMVVSHLVSNLVLVAVAVAPTAAVAVALLLIRQLMSQMDVPTRQAYVMAMVEDHEREAAAVATTLARTISQAMTPALTGWVMQAISLSAPFALGGGLKIVYDVLLYVTLKDVRLPSERR